MNLLARIRDGVFCADLNHLDRPEAIAAFLVETAGGLALVDPGPASCLEALHQAVRDLGATPGDVRHILLTHIHLDHAGVTGTLIRGMPHARVYVHTRGAPHLVDPARLLASANLIYGDAMQRLWGDVLPVPADQLVVLDGSETLALGNRRFAVTYTPGHAIHHLCYLDEHEGIAFVGDLAGEASQHDTPALPAAPPPDIDLVAWRASLDLLEAWRAEELMLTHFGRVRAPAAHVAEMWTRLVEWSEMVRESLAEDGSDASRAHRFAEAEHERLVAGLSPTQQPHVDIGTITASWYGLARYWRKRARLAEPHTADA
jgi:glyoxylase-like metal-dependent hydrolase (beta-lactamase superfamily II)